MGVELGVLPSGRELSRSTVVALLTRFLDDDPELAHVADGGFVELERIGERLSTDWHVFAGRTGIAELHVEVWDRFPIQPAQQARVELTPIIAVLREIAQQTGGRLYLEEEDVTDRKLTRILDLAWPNIDYVVPEGTVLYVPPDTPEQYLRRYLAAGEARLALLHEQFLHDQEPAPALDYSRDSLAPMWTWAIPQLRWRPDDAPRERVMLKNGSTFQRPVNANLPMWYGRSGLLAPYLWTDETMALLDAIAFYAMECVRRAVPGVTWQVAGRRNGYGGLPVLPVAAVDLEPISSLWPIAGRVFKWQRDPTQPEPVGDDLTDWYDDAVQRVRVPADRSAQ
jgi:hypothetical protein